MSEDNATENTSDEPVADGQDNPASEAPAAWEPEPRTWTWMDVFKAPMIACKFRCMLISIITIAALGFTQWLFGKIDEGVNGVAIVEPIIDTLACIVPCIVFGLGATLVAIFIKCELLDDDYPTFKEAMAQYKKRILAAILVPTFLMGSLHFMHFGAYLYDLFCSIPYVGSIFYFASIPSFFLWLLITFFSIGVMLSIFVFPAIVAIRKHGWFDNVIDTLEAVGTKPQKVFASLVMTGVLMLICCGIGITALYSAKGLTTSKYIPGDELRQTEGAAEVILDKTLPAMVKGIVYSVRESKDALFPYIGGNTSARVTAGEISGYHQYFTGALAGIFQTILLYLIAGYGLNIIISGGMLCYLHVREDDYWDDEDLADLEKLAKELEEEALKDQGDSAVAPADGDDKPASKDEESSEAKDDKQEDDSEAKDKNEEQAESEGKSDDESTEDDSKEDSEEAKDSEEKEAADDDKEDDKKDDK